MKQYAASPKLNRLISDRKSYFDTLWGDKFYESVWNVDTAQGFGLDIWGRIVVVGRYLEVAAGKYFGFDAPINKSWQPFNQAPFYTGQKQTSTQILQDPAYRSLILTKALTNISETDSRSLNRALSSLFQGRGNAYVKDLGNMEIQYVFDFLLEPWERAIVNTEWILPRPAGVKVSAVYATGEYSNLIFAIDRMSLYANFTLPSDMKIN